MAYYDSYDYPAYWQNRQYEHQSEVVAIRQFLAKIPHLSSIIELGAGYGRLTPLYMHRADKVVLTDASAKLLSEAKKRLGERKNLKFVQVAIENTTSRIRSKFDLVLVVRVLHHVKDINEALKTISKLLTPRGYVILEFPNKIHGKALLRRFIRGDITYPIDIFPQDVKKKNKDFEIPFFNYHPGIMLDKLAKLDFEIIEKRSVSNLRSTFLKRHIPLSLLISIERLLQSLLSFLYLGPSVFVLARKRG